MTVKEPSVKTDYGTSEIYDRQEMDEAIHVLMRQFGSWKGCELHSIRYAGDSCNNKENLRWLNEIREGREYTHCMEFVTDFHSPVQEEDLKGTAWGKDQEYRDYQWWLGRRDGGDWELVSWGY